MISTNVFLVGAGPIGLELASAFKLLKVDYLHVDAGQIGQTVTWYPRQVRFFSSPERIAIAGVPLPTVDQAKASREEYLTYLRGVVEQFDLKVQTYERVKTMQREHDGFVITTIRGGEEQTYRAQYVVLAIGDMHRPRRLNIPGEDLPHVSHYFDEPHCYFRNRLLIVGGRNSAVEAALRCQRAGAQVALSYRHAAFDRQAVKYWLLPEIELLIKSRKIAFYPNTAPTCITPRAVTLAPTQDTGDAVDVPADFVLLLVGYEMDASLFTQIGVQLRGENQAPVVDLESMQTNIPGLFVAGTAAAGTQVRFRLFIENCHPHVARIVRAITGHEPPFPTGDITHSGRYGLAET